MEINEQGEGFGAWLVKQTKRKDWIGALAKSAKSNSRFRAGTTADELRKRLQEARAEGDSFEARDDAEGVAESSWRSARPPPRRSRGCGA